MITSVAQNSPPSLVCTTLFQSSGTGMLCACGYSFHFCCFGILFAIKFATIVACTLKARLGGEIS